MRNRKLDELGALLMKSMTDSSDAHRARLKGSAHPLMRQGTETLMLVDTQLCSYQWILYAYMSKNN